MAYRRKSRGMGDTVPYSPLGPCTGAARIFDLHCWGLFPPDPVVAPPKAPTGDALTVPPANEEQAQSLVDDLVNQQIRDQQALDASRVTSSWFDRLASGIVDTGDAATSPITGGLSALAWGGLVLGAAALVFVGVSGGPRRYGR